MTETLEKSKRMVFEGYNSHRNMFFAMMKDEVKRDSFRCFLKSTYFTEGLEFLWEVSEFKAMGQGLKKREKGLQMFEKYMSNDSDNELPVYGESKKMIETHLKESLSTGFVNPELFGAVETEIVNLLLTGLWPKYLESNLFKEQHCTIPSFHVPEEIAGLKSPKKKKSKFSDMFNLSYSSSNKKSAVEKPTMLHSASHPILSNQKSGEDNATCSSKLFPSNSEPMPSGPMKRSFSKDVEKRSVFGGVPLYPHSSAEGGAQGHKSSKLLNLNLNWIAKKDKSPRPIPSSNESSPEREYEEEEGEKKKEEEDETRNKRTSRIVKNLGVWKRILIDNNFEFTRVLLDTALKTSFSGDEFWFSIIEVFSKSNKIEDLIEVQLREELDSEKQLDWNVLFREESVITKLVGKYFMLNGREFLLSILYTLIETIKTSGSFEIIPARTQPGENTKHNAKKLMDLVQYFFTDTFSPRFKNCPPKLKRACIIIKRCIDEKYPSMSKRAVGNLLFLRFVCPTIVTTDRDSKGEPLSAEVRRALILISKMLQNLVAGVEFDGSKEVHMIPLNTFILDNILSMNEFLEYFTSSSSVVSRDHESLLSHSNNNPRSSAFNDKRMDLSLRIIKKCCLEMDQQKLWDALVLRRELVPKLCFFFTRGLCTMSLSEEDLVSSSSYSPSPISPLFKIEEFLPRGE
jgi:hypothetical protein